MLVGRHTLPCCLAHTRYSLAQLDHSSESTRLSGIHPRWPVRRRSVSVPRQDTYAEYIIPTSRHLVGTGSGDTGHIDRASCNVKTASITHFRETTQLLRHVLRGTSWIRLLRRTISSSPLWLYASCTSLNAKSLIPMYDGPALCAGTRRPSCRSVPHLTGPYS